jgi:hypothetical protein
MMNPWIQYTIDQQQNVVATDLCRWQNVPTGYSPTELAGFILK